MRILHVRLKNLNSLAGEWCIDLTHPAYAAEGIFAITGPTGAGKTTLLDAMCLALYGRTPRLARVGKSGNEVMSRQTGECFAEVTFETPAGRFRCHWSQHRARRKPGGDLQQPRHEIAEADGEAGEGRVIEASLRGVLERVEAVTGMDFERFTRSMLLAQGGFAAFLQATPDERSPLLEQITGTEIYSRISMQAHERRGAERTRLAELQAALNGMAPLTPDEVQQLTQSLAEKTEADAALAHRLAQVAAQIQWRQGLDTLAQALDALAQEQAALQGCITAFAPEQARLHAAHQALELAADHTALLALRQADAADAQALADVGAALPPSEQALQVAQATQAAASQHLSDAKAAQQATQPLLREVRALDLKMAAQAGPLAELDEAIAQQDAQLLAQQARHGRDEAERDARQNDLAELQTRLTQTQGDAPLVENLAALRERFQRLAELKAEQTQSAQAITDAERALAQAAEQRQTRAAALTKARNALAQQQTALAAQTAELAALLLGQSQADWRRRQTEQRARQGVLTQAAEALRAREQATQALVDLARQRQALAEAHAEQSQTRVNLTGRQQTLATERDLLETQLVLLQRIADLEAARHQLQDGDPCPLCGALDHPYACGNVPVPDTTREHLAQRRAELDQVTRALADAQVRQARIAKDLELADAQQAQHTQARADAEGRLDHACARLPMDWVLGDDAELATRLETKQADCARDIAHIEQTLAQADVLEQTLATLRSRLDTARDAATQAERDELAATHAHESAGQTLAQRREAVQELAQRLARALAELHDAVRPYGVDAQAPGALSELTARRDRWQTGQARRDTLTNELAALAQQLDFQARQIGQSRESLAQLRTRRQAMQQALDRLAEERQALFTGQPDAEEARLHAAVTECDAALDVARQQHTQASQALAQCQDRQAALAQSRAERAPTLQRTEADFAARLQTSGFADEAAYRQACLPEPERRRLSDEARQLTQAQATLARQQRDKTALLASERERRLTDATPQALHQQQADLMAEQRTVQQAIGVITNTLRQNETLLASQQAQVAAIEAQKRECARWEQLHELIGSADGKKYRNFAQGLTFERVVRHANLQLRKMTDRYLLERDAAQPLELNVIDNDQAGEVRSTKNLSGGESFIVSLALALGLSQMASRSVRVDSLFLDEGFGTLDEDALDTALDTLAGLRQEGKLIGVISHVPALKDRIATQIQVAPLRGGKSSLSGPGCSAV